MLLIRNATIYTMEEDGILEGCDILIQDGKIQQLGPNLGAEGIEVIDATGLVAAPGLIDAHTHAGGGFTATGSDLNEITDPITPQVEAIHSIDIHEPSFKALHRAGITAACFIPGSANVICGTGFVAKTAGKNSVYDLSIRNPAAMKCAMGGNPKGYGKRGQAPATRMGIASLFRQALKKAQDYMAKKEAGGDTPPYDAKCEALIPVLRREIPLKIHCEQFDMLTAIEIAKEFGCDYTIEHAWACDLYADELVSGGGSLMFGPIGIPEGVGELTGGDVGLVGALDARGLNVCLVTDGPICGADVLLISAGEAVRYGVAHLRALAMVTLNAAKGLGVDDRIGSIKVGKDADIVLFDGIPALETSAKVITTIIDGQVAYQR